MPTGWRLLRAPTTASPGSLEATAQQARTRARAELAASLYSQAAGVSSTAAERERLQLLALYSLVICGDMAGAQDLARRPSTSRRPRHETRTWRPRLFLWSARERPGTAQQCLRCGRPRARAADDVGRPLYARARHTSSTATLEESDRPLPSSRGRFCGPAVGT